MKREFMDKLEYDEWHSRHMKDEELNSPWHKRVLATLQDGVDVRGKVVLEIGCGRGGFANHLAFETDAPEKIFACDYSETAIAIASKRYGNHEGRLVWKCENIERLSFADRTFDVIISCETIEHLKQPCLALKELYRVLKPNGYLLLTCPNYFNVFGLWCLYRWAIGKPYTEGGQMFVNYALMPQVYRWVRRAGFKVLDFQSSDFVVPLRAHYHFFTTELYSIFRIFGLQTFYLLRK